MTVIDATASTTPATPDRNDLGTLGSIELRARAIQLEERIARAKEDLAIARAVVSEGKRGLSDPDPKTSDAARKALARAREDVDRAESAYERVLAETQPKLDAVVAAVAAAERREAEAGFRTEFADLDRRIRRQNLRLATALAELGQAEADIVAIGRERTALVDRAAREVPGANFEISAAISTQISPDFTTMDRFAALARTAGIHMTLDRARMTWSIEDDPDA